MGKTSKEVQADLIKENTIKLIMEKFNIASIPDEIEVELWGIIYDVIQNDSCSCFKWFSKRCKCLKKQKEQNNVNYEHSHSLSTVFPS